MSELIRFGISIPRWFKVFLRKRSMVRVRRCIGPLAPASDAELEVILFDDNIAFPGEA